MLVGREEGVDTLPAPAPDPASVSPWNATGEKSIDFSIESAAAPVILTTLQTSIFPPSEDWPTPAAAEPCAEEWGVVACGCEARTVEIGCNRLRCGRCADFLRRRRAAAIAERIERGRTATGHSRAVLYTVFTVPLHRRKAAADGATWSRWRRKMWRFLRKRFGGAFAVERTDPAGDKRPDVWHPHLNFLWVQKDGFRPFLAEKELRAEWARIVGAEVVDVHHAFAVGEGEEVEKKRAHWYSYMGRTWAPWVGSVRRHLTVRWLGDYPRKKPEAEHVCPKCGEGYGCMRLGTREAADALAARGAAAVREEIAERADFLQEQEWKRPSWSKRRGGPHA